MSPTDLPPVTTPHAGEIIGSNWPEHSEINTVACSVDLFRRAAEAVGTADTDATMLALIEANATGHTPDELVSHFTDEQRRAFDTALANINRGHGSSVMAADILSTKVQLNGIVMSFEAAAEELLARAATATDPQTQEMYRREYNQLLEDAQQAAARTADNHRQTQESLSQGLWSGDSPEIPTSMTAPETGIPSVPGMPDGALGGMLQNVAGQLMKPQGLGLPGLESMMPVAQAVQSGVGQMMSSLGGLGGGLDGGVPLPEDTLAALSSTAVGGDQAATLAAPVGAAAGAGAAAGGTTRASLAGEDSKAESTSPAEENKTASALAATGPDSTALAAPSVTTPTAPSLTPAPEAFVPRATLSAAEAASTPEPLSLRAHTSSAADAAAGTTLLAPAAAAGGAGSPGMGGMPMMPMMPMAPGAGGGAHAGLSSTGGGSSPTARTGADALTHRDSDRSVPVPDLPSFSYDLRGLEHATEMQLVAGSVLAQLKHLYDAAGLRSELAVGFCATGAVFATSDGLGFLPEGACAAAHLTPLAALVGEEFTARWLGCDQPWRPLQEAGDLGLIAPFDAIVTTDAAGEAFGVLALTADQIAAMNVTAGSAPRWHFDAVDPEDVRGALDDLKSVWVHPNQPLEDLQKRVSMARWTDFDRSEHYPRRWAHYLLAAAENHLKNEQIDDARYVLRCAYRIPEPKETP